MSWTDEKVNKLKELWGKNTASQIAEQLGGVSRNAVIGKAHRLNLSAKLKTRSNKTSNIHTEDKKNHILKSKKGVVALGGGAFINRAIKNEVLENHLSFWLNWNIDTLVNRIKNSKKRPLAVNSSKNELIEIIKKRSIIYSKALYKIDCENFTKQQITKKIIDIYESN